MENQLTENSLKIESLECLETKLLLNRLAVKIGSEKPGSTIRLWEWLFMFDEAERVSFVNTYFEAEIQNVLNHQKSFSKNFGGYLSIENCVQLAEENYAAARTGAKRTIKVFSYVSWAVLAAMILLFFTTFSDFNFTGLAITAAIAFLMLISVDGFIYAYQMRKCQILKVSADLLRVARERESESKNTVLR